MKSRITVRPAYPEEFQAAMELAWDTFLRFDAPDYTIKGIASFREFIESDIVHQMFERGAYEIYLAFDNKELAGMLSVRNENHISLFFVAENHMKKGVGRNLLEYLAEYIITERGVDRITVDSSPYALEFYKKMGFEPTGETKENAGIKYTPMVFRL